MSKEHLLVEIPETIPQPYRGYMEQRNRGVGLVIAGILGIPELRYLNGSNPRDVYFVLSKTVTVDEAHGKGIFREEDLYGAAVEMPDHVGKSILHPTLSRQVPGFYSHEFARSVRELTLPGFTAFSVEDALAARKMMETEGRRVRLKLPDESDANGQYPLESETDLRGVLERIGAEEIGEKGIILEADAQDPETVSVGFAVVGGRQISFLAQQKNDIAPEDGRNRYKGAVVEVVRGDMNKLGAVARTERENLAVEQASRFYEAYSYFNPLATRLSFDVLFGTDSRGQTISGVTDITGRLGGTCPVLAEALKIFEQQQDRERVFGEVTLNYKPEHHLPEENEAVIYVDTPTLRLTARVLNRL